VALRLLSACSMMRFFLIFCGLVFLGSFGAFFLLVSLLSIGTVASILIGLMLMFTLGVHVGAREPQL
jgi:hypothetical protein